MTESEERDPKNEAIIKALREVFAPLTQQLTPDVEPATIYLPTTQEPENEE